MSDGHYYILYSLQYHTCIDNCNASIYTPDTSTGVLIGVTVGSNLGTAALFVVLLVAIVCFMHRRYVYIILCMHSITVNTTKISIKKRIGYTVKYSGP